LTARKSTKMTQIKATEFRIGNIVTIDNPEYHPKLKGIPLEITGISSAVDTDGNSTYSIQLSHVNQQPNTYYETYSQFLKFIKPILLTEHMLNKACGFTVVTFSSAGNKYGYIVNHVFNGALTFIVWKYGKDEGKVLSGNRHFDSLHKLQNYFYAEMEKELLIDFNNLYEK